MPNHSLPSGAPPDGTIPPNADTIRTLRVLAAISIKRKRRKGTNDRYLLKLNNRPVGTYTDTWLSDGIMTASLLERMRLTLQRTGRLGSNWVLIEDRSGSEICQASSAGLVSCTLKLKFLTRTAKLRSAGFWSLAAVLELDQRETVAKINRVVKCCHSGWRVTGVADWLRTTDMFFAGLIYHALSNELNTSC